MDYVFPLTVINREGKTFTFYEAQAFVDFATDRSNGRVGAYWIETRFGDFFYNKNHDLIRAAKVNGILDGEACDWIVRDSWGRPVDPSAVPGNRDVRYYGYNPNRFVQYDRSKAKAIADGNMPIPGTGVRRSRSKCQCSDCKARRGKKTTKGGLKHALRNKYKDGGFSDLWN